MDACCKVGRVISEYNLVQQIGGHEIEDYLIARWAGKGEYTPTGLRPLKDWFNQRLIKSVYTDRGRTVLDSRVESEYETLTADEPDFELLADLETDGIDGEQLQSDFVSTATLYRHFTACLDVSKPKERDADEPSTWETDKIDYAKDIVERNAEESLRALENKGRLPRGTEAQINTEIVLGCPDCSTQVGIDRAIERGYVCGDHAETGAEASPVDENAQ